MQKEDAYDILREAQYAEFRADFANYIRIGKGEVAEYIELAETTFEIGELEAIEEVIMLCEKYKAWKLWRKAKIRLLTSK